MRYNQAQCQLSLQGKAIYSTLVDQNIRVIDKWQVTSITMPISHENRNSAGFLG
jgi:hypothetical protein